MMLNRPWWQCRCRRCAGRWNDANPKKVTTVMGVAELPNVEMDVAAAAPKRNTNATRTRMVAAADREGRCANVSVLAVVEVADATPAVLRGIMSLTHVQLVAMVPTTWMTFGLCRLWEWVVVTLGSKTPRHRLFCQSKLLLWKNDGSMMTILTTVTAKKHKRTATKWTSTCSTRYKGTVAVKTYFEIRVPPERELEEKRIRAKVQMNGHFKAKVKAKTESNTKVKAKLKVHASVSLDVKSETEYKDRPRPSKTKLTASFDAQFNLVSSAHRDLREQFMHSASDIRSKAITSYTDYKAEFKASIDYYKESSASSGSSIRFNAEGKIAVKVDAVKQKVENGEDLDEKESRVMAKVSASASVDIDFKRKVVENDEAREFEKLRAAVENKRKKVANAIGDFSTDVRARLQATLDMLQELKTDAEQAEDDEIMDAMVAGDDLTDEQHIKIEANFKAGAEITVAKEDKVRMDFAAEASSRVSLSVLAAEEKQEVMVAFNVAAKVKIHMCSDAKLVTHSCKSNECWSITTEFRQATEAKDLWCRDSCRGGDSLSVACQKDTPLADKHCKCCGEEDEDTIVLEDECADLNAVWELVIDGDFEALNTQQESIIRKVLREGKAWANKKYLSYSNAKAKKYVDAEEYILNLVDWQEVGETVKSAISESLDFVKENKLRLHQYFSKEEIAAIDATKEKAVCECQEELGQGDLRIVRVSLDLKAKAEITTSEGDESSHKKITTQMKIKMKGEAGAEKLDTAEGQAAIRSTMGAMLGHKCNMCEVKKVGERRRLVACETGRCLETESTHAFSQTTDKMDAMGDLDENLESQLEAPDEQGISTELSRNLREVGAIGEGDSVETTLGAPETEDTNDIPKEPEFIAGTPESSVNSAKGSSAVLAFALAVLVWGQSSQ